MKKIIQFQTFRNRLCSICKHVEWMGKGLSCVTMGGLMTCPFQQPSDGWQYAKCQTSPTRNQHTKHDWNAFRAHFSDTDFTILCNSQLIMTAQVVSTLVLVVYLHRLSCHHIISSYPPQADKSPRVTPRAMRWRSEWHCGAVKVTWTRLGNVDLL